MTIGDDLVVRPPRALRGPATVPGDKSIAHRSLMLASLCDGRTVITGVPGSADVWQTRSCLAALGVEIASDGEKTTVAGLGLAGLGGPPVSLDCGRSGTTIRLMAGLLAGQDRTFRLEAHPQLAARPMDRVVAALAGLGATVACADGKPPIEGRGGALAGGTVLLVHASAQVGSAVLLAGLTARGPVTVTYPGKVRDHTERLLRALGAPVDQTGSTTLLNSPSSRLSAPAGRLEVPGDLSSAAFLVSAALVVPGSQITVQGVGLNPGRTGFLEVLKGMGADIRAGDLRMTSSLEPVGDLQISAGSMEAANVAPSSVPSTIDELPLVAVLACVARGTTEIRGASELRVKECDRIRAMAEGLTRLGGHVEELPDGLRITGPARLVGAAVDGYGDHRVVMALAVAGLVAEGTTTVRGAAAVADSFPGFTAAINALADPERVAAA